MVGVLSETESSSELLGSSWKFRSCGREGSRGGLSWFPETGFGGVLTNTSKVVQFPRGEHHCDALNAVAMTEFNRTSRPSGACNSAAQTGNIKVPTCTPQVAVEELVESFKRYLSRTEFDSGLCGANH